MSPSPQAPIGSGLDASTTTGDVLAGVDLTGKVAIVTGGYAGIGVATVRALRGAGASVVVPTRSAAKAVDALAGIDGVEIEPMDLLDPRSIDAFTARFEATGRPLHMLVNNAGIMMVPLSRDARGFESQLATNHLGHLQLTLGLWPALVRADGARVVNVSSWGHRHSDIVWDDLMYERRDYDPLTAYGQAKTANNLFAVEIDVRGEANGIRGFALHPGSIVTSAASTASVADLQALGLVDEQGEPIVDPSRNMKSVAQGAATSVWCATSSQLDGMGGVYCENCDVAPLVTVPSDPAEAAALDAEIKRFGSTPLGVMSYSVDPASASRLWDVSVELVRTRDSLVPVRVLVTGSAGFVGRAVVRRVAAAGHAVVPFDVRDGLDILDADALNASAHGCDAIAHLALAPGTEPNIEGTRNVLGAGVGRVVIASSIHALGGWTDGTSPDYLPIDDDHPSRPIDDYSVLKLAVERLTAAATDVVTICLRIAAVCDDAGIAATFDRRRDAVDDEWSPRWEYGTWVHADDVGDAFVAALTASPPDRHLVVPVVADDINTRRYTSHELAARLNPDVEWRGGEEYERDRHRSLVQTPRSRALLGWAPTRRWL